MTPPISMGIQSPLVITCPCVALPKGTVVVNKEDLNSALAAAVCESEDFHESNAYKSLVEAQEKKGAGNTGKEE